MISERDVLDTHQEPSPSPSYRVEKVRTEADFFALERSFKDLVSSLSNVPIFLTWEWISTWWRHFGQGKEPWILAAWDQYGRLAGLAPWMLERPALGLLRVRRISFIGSGIVYPAHMDIIAGEAKGEIWTAFLMYLNARSKEWDVLDLKALSDQSPAIPILPNNGWWYLERKRLICPYIPLPGDWTTFEMTALSRNRRWQLRKNRRELEQNHPGQVDFHQVSDSEELQPAMDSLIELSKVRWREKGNRSSFDDARFAAFLIDMVNLALQRGWLRFYQLKVADQVITTRCCFLYEHRLYDYQTAFNTNWGKYSPGELLLAHVVQEAIEEGVQEFDALTGVYRWKTSWAEKTRSDQHTLYSKNYRGRLWLLIIALFDRAVVLGKNIMPSGLQQKVERLLLAKKG